MTRSHDGDRGPTRDHRGSMTKADLIDEVSRLAELTRKDSEVIVETIFDSIVRSLRVGDKIEIRGFGSFRTRQRKPRVGRNPKSGEKVLVPEKRVPHFKAGKELRERVDRSLERQGEPSSEGESVSLAAVKAARQVDSTRQAAGFPVDTAVPLAMSR